MLPREAHANCGARSVTTIRTFVKNLLEVSTISRPAAFFPHALAVHIVIAPDKFKGSLTAAEAAAAIHTGFLKIFPEAAYTLLPLADGGEGILDAFAKTSATPGKLIPVKTSDALGREVDCEFLMLEKTAIIESSQANGLWRIPAIERDVSLASSYGVGLIIRAAVQAGAEKIIIGIGGSATNDAGLGIAAALGHRFLDANDVQLDPTPSNFAKISKIDSSVALATPPITVACDVANPLLGPNGATYIYGPQKGLSNEQLPSFDALLNLIADICDGHFGTKYREFPGSGAAGGIGYGLMTFQHATLESGFDCIANALGAEAAISPADLVITAEGSIDHQTLEGKTPHGVAKLARKYSIPVYALAGMISDEDLLHQHFDGIASIVNGPMTLEYAIANAPSLVERAATRLAHIIKQAG